MGWDERGAGRERVCGPERGEGLGGGTETDGCGKGIIEGELRQEKNPKRMSEDSTKERGGGLMRKKKVGENQISL